MELAEAVKKGHIMLREQEHCLFDRFAWAEVIEALLPAAEAQLARAEAAQGKQ